MSDDSRDGGERREAPAQPHAPDERPAALDEQRCDLCGAPLLEWHCRLICTACGFQRDCSDP